MLLPPSIRVLAFFYFLLWLVFPCMMHVEGSIELKHANGLAEEGRRTVAETDAGKISAVDVSDGYNGTYHLQFITMESSSLFLPVLLQSDMIIYVHTGNGTLSWADENEVKRIDLERGDVYKLDSGSVFYMQSKRDSMGTKLTVHAFFTSMSEDNTHERFVGAYSTLADLMFGFGSDVLQKAFKASEVVVDEILKAGRPPMIVPAESRSESKDPEDWKQNVIKGLLLREFSLKDFANKKKKDKEKKEKEKEKDKKKDKTPTFNLFSAKPDFQNCNGWSLSVTNKDLKALQDTDVSIFLVNLNKGSMMGPHWNPEATEVAIVTKGKGIVKLVCPSEAGECKETSSLVGEGDVFAVPRYHAMVQMSFNNDSFAFMGFTTRASNNQPQFLAGKSSVLKLLDVGILAKAFNVSNSTINQLLGSREEDSIIMDCTSCAEEELRRMEEEEEGEGREPGKEEERKREKEEEESERREEEESKKHEEERKRHEQEEEEKKKEEEEEEEEKRKKEEEEEESKKGREEEGERRHGGEEEEEEGRGEGDPDEEMVRLERPWKKVWRV